MLNRIKDKKTISFIVPVYNEEKNVDRFHKILTEVLVDQTYRYEIIFIDDGSTDCSVDKLRVLQGKDNRIRIIEFTRNFGKEIAVTAGINSSDGDACIIIDADLQHPIELIPEFIDKWEKGAEVVVGVRRKNKREGFIKKFGSIFFYKILGKISEIDITPSSTDYRMLDKVVITAFNRFSERNRMTRALIDWLGFKRDYIHFEANERTHGEASYNFYKLIRLAFNSFVSLSLFPLRLAGYLGIFIIFFSGSTGLFIFVEKYILRDPLNLNFSGTSIVAILTIFLVGIILICLGLIALYIANIHDEVIGRPLYVIRDVKNYYNQIEHKANEKETIYENRQKIKIKE